MGKLLSKNELAEIMVIGDQYALFLLRNGQYVAVSESLRIVVSYGGDIMTKLFQVGN